MERTKMAGRMTSGALAGLAGTAAIMGLQLAGEKAAPRQMPPMRKHPGRYLVQKAERLLTWRQRARVPRTLEETAAQLLGVGYGVTFASLYGALHRRKRGVWLEGTALGLATWAAGYLGWLPATGLMRPVTRQRPAQVAGAVLSHLVYGMTTAATLRRLTAGQSR